MAAQRIKSYLTDQSGAVAATYALALFGLVVIGGVGFDYGRLAAMDSELQNGADQAALAGATQLDGKLGACQRAADRAADLVTNKTLLANDSSSITFPSATSCSGATSGTSYIRFYKTYVSANSNSNSLATSDADARFIEIRINTRSVRYAFTPLTSLFFGPLQAGAMAGLGSSICKVPPIMICNPNPGQSFDAASKEGIGVVATGHATGNAQGGANAGSAGTNSKNTWAPGDFGFLQINDPGSAASRNQQLLMALAFANPPIDCTPVDNNKVSTGNPQGLYDAINTRFDIYDFNSNNGNGNVLGSCQGGSCPSAPNVVKDMLNSNPNASCKITKGSGAGWKFPGNNREFKPVTKASSTNSTLFDDNGVIDAMGLPRDNCHYTSYNGSGICTGERFGDGVWDRADYFKTNHTVSGSVDYPPNWTAITRYKTYQWELDNNKVPDGNAATSQRGKPVCYAGSPPGGRERRVLTVAIVNNCASLNGQSSPVEIGEWVDMFLVEPSSDDAVRYNAYKDAIYMEVIGPSKLGGGNGLAAQLIRRDVPYLVH